MAHFNVRHPVINVYVVNRLWGYPPPPYQDDIVYGRPLVSVVQEVTIVYVVVSRSLSQKFAYIVIVFSLACVILCNFLIFEILVILYCF